MHNQVKPVDNTAINQEVAELFDFIETLEKFCNWRIRTEALSGGTRRGVLVSDHTNIGNLPEILGNGQMVQQVATDLQNACVKILDPIALKCRQRIRELTDKQGTLGLGKIP